MPAKEKLLPNACDGLMLSLYSVLNRWLNFYNYFEDGHGFLALMSCVLPKMIEVNRKYIIMEGTASSTYP